MDPLNQDESWLHGYSVSGVGGLVADEPVRVGPLARMNFLVGRNNHGKSTLLRAAQDWVERKQSSERLERRRETLVPVSREAVVGMLRQVRGLTPEQIELEIADVLVDLDTERVGVWVPRELDRNTTAAIDNPALMAELGVQLGLGGYSITLSGDHHLARQSVTIPAFRELRPFRPGQDSQRTRGDLASGEGLIAELSDWERPKRPGTANYTFAKDRWERLRAFMREVLEDPEADLEVAGQEDLHVRLAQAGQMLHIDSLGDGIKQVLMIAAAAIYFDNHLVLLEEPEIHLHAGLQRKLVRFLAKTDNQYIIATHSAHVLDLPGAKIFHVIHDGTSSRVSSTVQASDVHAVSHDLGYMASDLLQANYTIWVEGPSDRVYWRRWLKLVDADLEEGIHYAVMTYGGYLVDGLHLRDEADVQDDLIALLQLGRTCTLIADSDKTSSHAKLRKTLKRLELEAASSGSGDLLVCTWVRTVENLIPRKLFRSVVVDRHRRAGQKLKTPETHSPYDDPFEGMGRSSYSKVRIARAISERLTTDDMDKRLVAATRSLAAQIRAANGLPANLGGTTSNG